MTCLFVSPNTITAFVVGVGGGKRASAGSKKELNKEEKIALNKNEQDIIMLQLKNHPLIDQIANIMQKVELMIQTSDKHLIKAALQSLSLEVMMKIQTNVNANNHEDVRLVYASKQFFSDEFAVLDNVKTLAALSESAMNCAAKGIFLQAYLAENGRISWDDYKTDVSDFIVAKAKSVAQ